MAKHRVPLLIRPGRSTAAETKANAAVSESFPTYPFGRIVIALVPQRQTISIVNNAGPRGREDLDESEFGIVPASDRMIRPCGWRNDAGRQRHACL